MKTVASLCFLPNVQANGNDFCDNTPISSCSTTTSKMPYACFQGYCIDTTTHTSFGLLGRLSVAPPKVHPCCFGTSDPPLFWDVCIVDYDTGKQSVIPNVQQFSSMGDAIRLSTEYDDWVVRIPMLQVSQDVMFKEMAFEPEKVKIDQDAYAHMCKYFKDLQPTQDALVLIGQMDLN